MTSMCVYYRLQPVQVITALAQTKNKRRQIIIFTCDYQELVTLSCYHSNKVLQLEEWVLMKTWWVASEEAVREKMFWCFMKSWIYCMLPWEPLSETKRTGEDLRIVGCHGNLQWHLRKQIQTLWGTACWLLGRTSSNIKQQMADIFPRFIPIKQICLYRTCNDLKASVLFGK